MTERQLQSVFASLVPRLIDEAIRMGFETTLGECWRSPEEALRLSKLKKGIKNSLHTHKLAIDLNLFRNGLYLKDTEAHRMLGTWWEMQSAGKDFVCHWGGHFNDGNHYSIGWNGLR